MLFAVAFYATVGVQPTQAYERNVCTHSDTIHRGPDGRRHYQEFVEHYYYRGQHYHEWRHFRAVAGGRYIETWQRTFNCGPANA